jgi:hypothetical protein
MKTNLAVSFAVAVALAVAGGAAAKAKPTPAQHGKPKPAASKPAARKPSSFDAQLASLGLTCAKSPVDLKGAVGSVGGGFVAVAVDKASGGATSSLVGKQVAVRLLPATKIVRDGTAKASDLKAGDALKVLALTCSQGIVAKSLEATPKHS